MLATSVAAASAIASHRPANQPFLQTAWREESRSCTTSCLSCSTTMTPLYPPPHNPPPHITAGLATTSTIWHLKPSIGTWFRLPTIRKSERDPLQGKDPQRSGKEEGFKRTQKDHKERTPDHKTTRTIGSGKGRKISPPRKSGVTMVVDDRKEQGKNTTKGRQGEGLRQGHLRRQLQALREYGRKAEACWSNPANKDTTEKGKVKR